MINNIGEARRSYALTTDSGEFTQAQAAAYFCVSQGTYSHWEQGVGKLNGDILCRIADLYGTSVDYLLCRTDDPTPYPEDASGALSAEERTLVDDFRTCTRREKNTLLETASTMAEGGRAKNVQVSDERAAAG